MTETQTATSGQTSSAAEPSREAELHPARPEPAGHHRVPDPDLNHRGAYDYEAETARRAELGLTFASGNSEPPRERATQGGTPSAGDHGR